MGVGSAVTVAVGVSVAGRVAGVEEGLIVRDAVLAGAAMTGVSCWGDAVLDGNAEGMEVAGVTAADCGVGGASPVRLVIQFPKLV